MWEIKEDEMTGKVFRETLRVLGWTRMKVSRRIYLVECSVCKQDSEIFGDGCFETSKESLTRGYQPCGCGRAYRFSEEQYTVLVNRKAKSLGVEFLGFTEEFKGGQTKCLISCSEGECNPKAHNFIYKGHISFNRGKARKEDSGMVQSFMESGAFIEGTKFTRERKYNKWYWRVDCPVCESTGVSQPQHLQMGCRPCLCGNYRQVFSYVTGIYDGELPVALKFGITRSKTMRIKYQSRETSFDLKSLGMWEFPSKELCHAAEKECLDSFECGILLKEEFGDGYTETTHVFNYERIVEIYENSGGVRLCDDV